MVRAKPYQPNMRVIKYFQKIIYMNHRNMEEIFEKWDAGQG